MITVKFFASLRERLSCNQLELAAEDIHSINDVIEQLSVSLPKWSEATYDNQVLCALNHTIVDRHTAVRDGDEVAFFPPVTGG